MRETKTFVVENGVVLTRKETILGEVFYFSLTNRCHREDGPAYTSQGGSEEWIVNGETHRTNGPALIWSSGKQAWYIHNKKYYTNETYQVAAGLSDEEMLMVILKYGNVNE